MGLTAESLANRDYGQVIKEYIKYFSGLYSDYTKFDIGDAEAVGLLMNLQEMLKMQIHEILPARGDRERAEKEVREYLRLVSKVLMPFCEWRMKAVRKRAKKEGGAVPDYAGVWRKLLALVACRSVEHFAYYMDFMKPAAKRVWRRGEHHGSMKCMRGIAYHATRMILDGAVSLLRASCPVSYGKSYMFNLCACFQIGIDPYSRVILITESDLLVRTSARHVKNMLLSKEFAEVFPFFEQYSGNEGLMFESATKTELVLACSQVNSYTAVTRLGASNGVRCELLILDDLTKGAVDADNPKVHAGIVSDYDNVWTQRADGVENMRVIAGGTCWADFDLLNVIEKRVADKQEIIADKRNPYTRISADGQSVFVAVPNLDYDTDESTLPDKYPTEYLRNQRDNVLSEEMWWARCQQRPMEPKGLFFNWDLLRTYEQIPEGELYVAILDPPKTGKNNLSLAIFKSVGEDLVFVNCIYDLTDLEKRIDDVVEMIVRYKCREFHYEQNSDYTLKLTVDQKIKSLGSCGTAIVPFYTTDKKEDKIFLNRNQIKEHMVFPKKGMYAKNSDIGRFMSDLTTYNPKTFRNKNVTDYYDDAPDTCAMAVMRFLDNMREVAPIQSFNRRRLRSR